MKKLKKALSVKNHGHSRGSKTSAAALSPVQSTWLYLIACALNNDKPDKERILRLNPKELYVLANAHSMLSVTAFALNAAGIHEKHFDEAKAKAIRKLGLFELERGKIFDELNKLGIWHMPLKGILLKDDYPAFGMREMTDNDILCDPERMDEVKAVMDKLGYECDSFGKWEHDIYSKPPCIEFEMHRALFKRDKMPEFASYYDGVLDRLKNAGNSEYRFTDEDFYIYMLAHEYKHFSNYGTGVRSLADIYVFLGNHKNLDWDYLNTELSKLKLSGFEKHSRETANKVFTNAGLTADETEQLLRLYLDSSLFGSEENGKLNKLTRTLGGRDSKGVKAKYLFNRFFLSGDDLKKYYPFFHKHKALLPALYIYRPIKGLILRPKKNLSDLKRLVKYKSSKHKL